MFKINRDKSLSAYDDIDQIMRAHRKTNILFSAFETGILEYLSENNSSISEIATNLNLSNTGVERILSALMSFGIIKRQMEFYQLSAEYKPLFTPNTDNNIGGLIKHEIHLQHRWLRLTESIKSGKPVKKTGKVRKLQDTKRFIAAMSNVGRKSAPVVLEKIKLRGDEHILDLAGGPGIYMMSFCEKYPNIKITLLDLPETIKFAKTHLAEHKAYNRMSFISGDLFESEYGKSYDVIFISNVIHIFDIFDTKLIFKKCYSALNRGGRILIKDFYLNDRGAGPEFSAIFSLHMLLSTEGGKCYMPSQLNSILQEVGFTLGKKRKITENSLVLEGIKYS